LNSYISSNHLIFVKKRLFEHEALKPKSTHKVATHNRDTKQTTEHKKERPKSQPQDLSCPSKISHPISKRPAPGASDCASLVCRFVTARLPVSLMWSRFAHCGHHLGRVTTMGPEIPLLWVVKVGLEARDPLGGDIRSGKNGVDAVETVTKGVKMVEKTIRPTSVWSGTTSEKPIYIPR
jgi:hypothetical protein